MLKNRKWMRFAGLLTILSLLAANVDMTAFAAEKNPEAEVAAQIQETEQTQETQSEYGADDNADVETVRTEDTETAVIESSVIESSVEETASAETTETKAEETEPTTCTPAFIPLVFGKTHFTNNSLQQTFPSYLLHYACLNNSNPYM